MTRTLAILVLAAAACTAAEKAQTDPVAAVFGRIDTDGSGAISKQEWMPLRTKYATGKFQQEHPKAYGQADSNDDGRLSQDEIWSFPHWPGFERFDADGDGSISRAEWNAMAGKLREAFAAKRGQR